MKIRFMAKGILRILFQNEYENTHTPHVQCKIN